MSKGQGVFEKTMRLVQKFSLASSTLLCLYDFHKKTGSDIRKSGLGVDTVHSSPLVRQEGPCLEKHIGQMENGLAVTGQENSNGS